MVKLTPEQQHSLVSSCPDVFIPCKGAWGRSGCTMVNLAAATESATKRIVKEAIGIVYENLVAATRPAAQGDSAKQKRSRRPSPGEKS